MLFLRDVFVILISLQNNVRVEFMKVDLGSLHSVKEMADAFILRGLPLHSLICNAGVFSRPLRCIKFASILSCKLVFQM